MEKAGSMDHHHHHHHHHLCLSTPSSSSSSSSSNPSTTTHSYPFCSPANIRRHNCSSTLRSNTISHSSHCCITHRSASHPLGRTDGSIAKISPSWKDMSLLTSASGPGSSAEEVEEKKWSVGRVLGPAEGEFPWWDRQRFAGAVVVRENGVQGPYRMYYYGRGGDMWNMGVQPFNLFLPTGRIGLATSPDGLSFVRYRGHLEGGAIVDPSDNPTDFDCVHIAVSDVHYQQEEKLWLMHYFAGGLDEAVVEGFSELPFKGIKLRPGMATSTDGFHFQSRTGPILNLGDASSWDKNGVSWPRVLLPYQTPIPGRLQGKWVMTYHTRELGVGPGGAGYFSAGLAVSENGKTWQKLGKILSAGSPESWDENGVSVRHVVRIGSEYAMFYEGSNYKGEFAIGLAVSDDGLTWKKDDKCGGEPGGPVFKARKGEHVWDNMIVGTPYVLPMEDGSFRMYYLGVGSVAGEATKQGIGLAVSKGSDFRTWSRIDE